MFRDLSLCMFGLTLLLFIMNGRIIEVAFMACGFLMGWLCFEGKRIDEKRKSKAD